MLIRSLAVAALSLLALAPIRAGDSKDKADGLPLVFRGTLDPNDPTDRLLKKSPHKVHEVQLAAGQVYQIDLASKDFDAFLRLEDGQGKHLAHDDDSGGGTDARLHFNPSASGSYRVIATAVPKGQPRGAYTLTVRLADEQGQREYQAQALNAAGL